MLILRSTAQDDDDEEDIWRNSYTTERYNRTFAFGYAGRNEKPFDGESGQRGVPLSWRRGVGSGPRRVPDEWYGRNEKPLDGESGQRGVPYEWRRWNMGPFEGESERGYGYYNWNERNEEPLDGESGYGYNSYDWNGRRANPLDGESGESYSAEEISNALRSRGFDTGYCRDYYYRRPS